MDVTSLYAEAAPQPAAAPAALELVDVLRIFSSGEVEAVALRGLSMRIERGEVVAVRGPSGSGKSTFLALAAGLDVPSAGEVRVDGRSLLRAGDDELAEYRAKRVAVVFQHDNLWPSLSALENVRASMRLAGLPSPRSAARDALAAFGLGDRAGSRPSQLSGGEQQRVAIAAAWVRRAPLVLADEPTGELDAANERLVLDALLELREAAGSAIIVVTHSSVVAEAADRVIEIRDGMAVDDHG